MSTVSVSKQKKHRHEQDFIKRSTGEKVFNVVNIIFMLILLCLFLFPVFNVVSISLSDDKAVLAAEVTFYPIGYNPQAYTAIFGSMEAPEESTEPEQDAQWQELADLYTEEKGDVLGLIGTCVAAYPMAYGNFYGKKLYVIIIMFTMWFNAGIVPLFLTIRQLGLYDSLWALILNSMITAYNVVIIRSYFSSIPFSVIESARIDGATDYRILFQLVIPLSKPVLATVALWLIVGHWNDYLNPLVLIHSQEHKTLQLFLKELVLNAETSTSNLASVNDATNKGVAALSQQLKNGVLVVSMVPMLVLYPFLQKFFVSGVMLGSVKG